MANTVRFLLRKPNEKNTNQSIYIAYNFDSNRKLFYSTGLKVKPKEWNFKKQRITSTDVINKDIINNQLNETKTELEKYIYNLKTQNKIIEHSDLKNFLDKFFYPERYTKNATTLFDFIKSFIKQSETRINHKTGKHVSYKTIREYERTFYFLKEYSKNRKKQIDFIDIDLNFYYDFIDFLQSLNLATNTIGHKILTLKTFLNDATDRNINTNHAYKSPKFKVLKEKTESVYLTENELKQIYDYDFSNNKRLETVRDIFLVASYTGLRFSDLKSINENIDFMKNRIYIKQEKTGNKVVIPLNSIVKEILNKYNKELPKIITNQKFNEYIKEVCKIAEINETVSKTMTKGGKKVTEKLEKYKLIGTHTARRSFATNLYKNGFPSISIMQITGHKTEDAFLKYIKVTSEEHAKLLEKFWNNQNK